jgi:hypothetical protein
MVVLDRNLVYNFTRIRYNYTQRDGKHQITLFYIFVKTKVHVGFVSLL